LFVHDDQSTPGSWIGRRGGRGAAITICAMLRRLLPAVALALLAVAPAAHATISQTPDVTDTRFLSKLVRATPAVKGVSWRVIDRNDELMLTNHSSQPVVVYAYSAAQGVSYDGGQYIRIEPDGTVQVNENSPAYYLNQSFFPDYANVPKTASATATPDWVTLAKTGSYLWHDHRIHYTSFARPTQVTDAAKTTFLYDWYVPIQVGSQKGYLLGQLYWLAQTGFSFPIAAIIALVVIVIGGAAFVIVVRRRRGPRAPQEAW
jgi:hypothetical protein